MYLLFYPVGTFPWEQASPNDVHYKDFIDWQLSLSSDIAVLWRKFTPEALRLFQHMLNLDICKRCHITELQNYLQYSWLQTNVTFEDSISDISSLCRTPNPDNNGERVNGLPYIMLFLSLNNG